MAKLKIKGELYTKEELSHQEFIFKFMKALKSQDIHMHFVGETKEVEDIESTE